MFRFANEGIDGIEPAINLLKSGMPGNDCGHLGETLRKTLWQTRHLGHLRHRERQATGARRSAERTPRIHPYIE